MAFWPRRMTYLGAILGALFGFVSPGAAVAEVDTKSLVKLTNDQFYKSWQTNLLVAPDFKCSDLKRRHVFYLEMDKAPETQPEKGLLKTIITKSLLSLGYSSAPYYCHYYGDGPKLRFRAIIVSGGTARAYLDFATRDEFFKGSEASQDRLYAAIDAADMTKEAAPKAEPPPPGKPLFWAVSMRRYGAGWGYAAAPTPQKAAELAIAECESFRHIAGKTIQPYQTDPRRKSACTLFYSYAVKDKACFHIFFHGTPNVSVAMFHGAAYGTLGRNPAKLARDQADKLCYRAFDRAYGRPTAGCGSFVRYRKTVCSKQFR